MRLYLDANAIIYAIQGVPALRRSILRWIDEAEGAPNGTLITSALSILECRVKPLRDGDATALARIDQFFQRDRLLVAEVTRDVIARATELRAHQGFKAPDAIHLATALLHQASTLLTADAAFERATGIKIARIEPHLS